MNTSVLDTEDALGIETDRDPAAMVMKHAGAFAPLEEAVAEAVSGIAPRMLRKRGGAVARAAQPGSRKALAEQLVH